MVLLNWMAFLTALFQQVKSTLKGGIFATIQEHQRMCCMDLRYSQNTSSKNVWSPGSAVDVNAWTVKHKTLPVICKFFHLKKKKKAIFALYPDALPVAAWVITVLQGSAPRTLWFQWKSFKIRIHD